MRTWAFLLGGLLVWAGHFFALYIVASIFPETVLARVLTGLLTLVALGAGGWLLWTAGKGIRRAVSDGVGHWTAFMAGLGAALALVAVAWQGLAVLLG